MKISVAGRWLMILAVASPGIASGASVSAFVAMGWMDLNGSGTIELSQHTFIPGLPIEVAGTNGGIGGTVAARADYGGGFYQLNGPRQVTHIAAFNFGQTTYMATQLDFALRANEGFGGTADLNYLSTAVLTDIRVTNSIGIPIDGAFSLTSASATVYPFTVVPLPATVWPLLTGIGLLVIRKRARRSAFRRDGATRRLSRLKALLRDLFGCHLGVVPPRRADRVL